VYPSVQFKSNRNADLTSALLVRSNKKLEMEFALTAAQFPNPQLWNWNSGLMHLPG